MIVSPLLMVIVLGSIADIKNQLSLLSIENLPMRFPMRELLRRLQFLIANTAIRCNTGELD